MPRKSIFKRNKKKVINKEEENKEDLSLQRSSGDTSSLNINPELYKDINSFGNIQDFFTIKWLHFFI